MAFEKSIWEDTQFLLSSVKPFDPVGMQSLSFSNGQSVLPCFFVFFFVLFFCYYKTVAMCFVVKAM